MITVVPGGVSAGETFTISSLCGSPPSALAPAASLAAPSSPDGSARYAPTSSAVTIHSVKSRTRRLPRIRSGMGLHRARGRHELAERHRRGADPLEAVGEPGGNRAPALDLE